MKIYPSSRIIQLLAICMTLISLIHVLHLIYVFKVNNIEIPRDQTKGTIKIQKTRQLHEIRGHK